VITRVAGTGTAGNGGDDGPATDAELDQPSGVAVTADGEFRIADWGNNVVRKQRRTS
jgi:NHL repeat